MYIKRRSVSNIAELVAKVQGKAVPTPPPVVYSNKEVAAARSVLDRLLAHSKDATLLSITPTRIDVREP